jgi:hypothetical protein
MIESPLIRELMAENSHRIISKVLQARFKEVPQDILDRLGKIQKEKKLDELAEFAATCKDLKAFRTKLFSS